MVHAPTNHRRSRPRRLQSNDCPPDKTGYQHHHTPQHGLRYCDLYNQPLPGTYLSYLLSKHHTVLVVLIELFLTVLTNVLNFSLLERLNGAGAAFSVLYFFFGGLSL